MTVYLCLDTVPRATRRRPHGPFTGVAVNGSTGAWQHQLDHMGAGTWQAIAIQTDAAGNVGTSEV